MNTEKEYDVTEVGNFRVGFMETAELRAGDVGYIAGSIKNVKDARVGDTITEANRPAAKPLKVIDLQYLWYIVESIQQMVQVWRA